MKFQNFNQKNKNFCLNYNNNNNMKNNKDFIKNNYVHINLFSRKKVKSALFIIL